MFNQRACHPGRAIPVLVVIVVILAFVTVAAGATRIIDRVAVSKRVADLSSGAYRYSDDTDGDGLTDGQEVLGGTNPLGPNSPGRSSTTPTQPTPGPEPTQPPKTDPK